MNYFKNNRRLATMKQPSAVRCVNVNENLWELKIKTEVGRPQLYENDDENFSTIYANTPWQVLHSPPRICQRGLAGSRLAPVQRTYNERVRVYTITFLPPGMFL